MTSRWMWILVAVPLAAAPYLAPNAAAAQQPSAQAQQPAPKAKRTPRANAPQPDLQEEDQLSPRQLQERPAARPRQTQQQPAQRPPAAEPPADQTAQPAQPARQAEPARTVACAGPFAKASSHLALATRYGSQNVTFAEVDGPDGTKLMASVLYPNDPKRRLEVLWKNEAARSETSLIAINGQSTWAAPKGLRLGMQLAALEKLNGKPFKLSGLDKDNVGSVVDWQGGSLAKLPGGCKIGIRLTPDPNAPPEARSELAADKEFVSSDASVKAIKPRIAEILIGY
jgi:hypothetical protein